MISTLAGSNSYLLGRELKKIIDEFLNEYGDLGLERIDGEEATYDRMREALESLPFLASKKLVILRAPSPNKEFAEKVETLLENLPDSTDLIIVEPKLDKRTSYAKFLKKKTSYNEYSELDEYGLSSWLVTEAKTKKGSLTANDARYLVSRVGVNQQMLSNELDKLLSYSSNVTKETIDLLTEQTPQSTVFELLDAALSGNNAKTLKLYQEQRALKVEPQAIIALLSWQLHALAVVKTAGDRSDDDIARTAKLNPFVVRKTRILSKNVSVKDAKQYVSELLELDIALKTTAIDANDALQVYLLKLGN